MRVKHKFVADPGSLGGSGLESILTDLPPSFGRIFGSNLLMSLKKSRFGRGHVSAYTCTLAGRVVVAGGVIPNAAKMVACLASGRAS